MTAWHGTLVPIHHVAETQKKPGTVLIDCLDDAAECVQVAAGRCVPVLADFTWLCRKIVGKTCEPRPLPCAALAADPELEAHLFEQLQNAAAAVHDTVCEERIIAYEAAAAGVHCPTPPRFFCGFLGGKQYCLCRF